MFKVWVDFWESHSLDISTVLYFVVLVVKRTSLINLEIVLLCPIFRKKNTRNLITVYY